MGLATSKYSVGGGGSLEDKGSGGKFGVSCLSLWRFDAEMVVVGLMGLACINFS